MKTIKIFIVLTLFSVSVFAQKIDEEKMDRDIKVAENILSTLLNNSNGSATFFGSTIRGTFIDDYGVIFTLPNRFHNGIYGRTTSFTYSDTGDENVVFYRSDDESPVAVNVPKVEVKRINTDSLETVNREKMLEEIKVFLADYGNLISQLGAEHWILLTNNQNDSFHWGSNSKSNEFSVEAKVANINAYKSGKMSRAEFMKTIKITNKNRSEEKSKDLELLTSIMNRLYKSDLSNTYYTNNSISYDRLSDFGVIYRMKVYSSSGSGDIHTIVTRHQDNLTQQERNAIVKSMYPEFLASLKENILDYGRTLNSLKSEEMLMFKVEMTKCVGCNLPKVVEVSLKNAVLQDYAAGKISKEEALKKFSVREGELQ